MAKEGRALRPEGRGRVLTAFLQAYFAAYMDYGFTAGMEDQLDAVSGVGCGSLCSSWEAPHLPTLELCP